MILDRNLNQDGKGKYALVRLRGIEKGSEAHSLLLRLFELGYLDWGVVGDADEFFVIKLRDKFSFQALKAYADEVEKAADDPGIGSRESVRLSRYALDVMKLARRSGVQSPFCKEPD